MNDFASDDAFQRAKRDELLLPGFYGEYACEGRYVVVDKGRLATLLQQRYAIDTWVQGRDGTCIAIEEKIVRWKGYRYHSFFFETRSCTVPGFESDGWMVYGKADYLLYCFTQADGGLECWLIEFPALQAWFWPRVEQFKLHVMDEKNRSEGRLVPTMMVHRAVRTWRRRIARVGDDVVTEKVA